MACAHLGLPLYIAGPVVATATHVVVRFVNGNELRVEATSAPPPLDNVRFYATPLPDDQPLPPTPNILAVVECVAGVDGYGQVVACLAPRTAKNCASRTSDCS
jgi:hypothetical protein